jgi:hypothetical protein
VRFSALPLGLSPLPPRACCACSLLREQTPIRDRTPVLQPTLALVPHDDARCSTWIPTTCSRPLQPTV